MLFERHMCYTIPLLRTVTWLSSLCSNYNCNCLVASMSCASACRCATPLSTRVPKALARCQSLCRMGILSSRWYRAGASASARTVTASQTLGLCH